MSWSRHFASLRRTTFTRLVRNGEERIVAVDMTIRKIPEWRRTPWAIEITYTVDGDTFQLCNPDDAPQRTLSEAKRTAFEMAASGWSWYPGLGYCSR